MIIDASVAVKWVTKLTADRRFVEKVAAHPDLGHRTTLLGSAI